MSICNDGMCPYIPCEIFPECNHLQEQLDFEKQWESDRTQFDWFTNHFENAEHLLGDRGLDLFVNCGGYRP